MEPVCKALQPRLELVHAVRETVVGDHRRDCREQPQRGGEQRLGNARCDHRKRAVLLLADLEKAVHDPPYGAEQTDERSDRAGRGEEIEPGGKRIGLLGHGCISGNAIKGRTNPIAASSATLPTLMIGASTNGKIAFTGFKL